MDIIYYLKPKSNFVDDLPHSDTLFGAICWGIKLLYGEDELTKILKDFSNNSPSFLISSTFPYIETEAKKIHFLPKPDKKPIEKTATSLKEIEKLKKFKKIVFLTSSIFNEIIQNKLIDEEIYNSFCEEKEYKEKQGNIGVKYIKIGTNLIEKELIDKLVELELKQEKDLDDAIKRLLIQLNPFRKLDILHNAINRLTSGTIEGKLFYDENIFFTPKAGLFFLLKIYDESLKTKLNTVINFFADKGIGKDSSIGKGQFEVKIEEEISLFNEPEKANAFVTLSLYYPTEFELSNFNKELVWYELIKRKGKIESAYVPFTDIWKKTILMCKEGSTFPLLNDKKFYGKNPIVKKVRFDVQQYGYAYPVRMVI